MPTVALVGYTNAGKTTLFNVLTRADAEASNALFVTLDPLVRQVRLPDSRELLRVGHRRLHRSPAARAGRGVSRHARGDRRRRPRAARHRRRRAAIAIAAWPPSHRVLDEVGAVDVPLLEVYNKCDALTRRRAAPAAGSGSRRRCASRRSTRQGIDELVETDRVAPGARRAARHADVRSRQRRRSRADRAASTATPGSCSTKRATAGCRSSPTCRAGCSSRLG